MTRRSTIVDLCCSKIGLEVVALINRKLVRVGSLEGDFLQRCRRDARCLRQLVNWVFG